MHDMKSLAAAVLLFLMTHCIFGDCVAFVRAQEQRKPDTFKLENIQGCYELTLSAWRPNLDLGEDAAFLTPPHRIQLFAERDTQDWEFERYVVKPAPGVEPSMHSASFWWPKSSQSIKILWTTGFSGLVMVLKIEATDLRGEAKSFWHFPRTRQTADVIARKVGCQAIRSENPSSPAAATRGVPRQCAPGRAPGCGLHPLAGICLSWFTAQKFPNGLQF